MSRFSPYFPVLTGIALFFPESSIADCCLGRGPSSSGAVPPAGKMMGPLNQPLRVTMSNPSSSSKTVTMGGIGGVSATVPPGTNSVDFGGGGSNFAPQPGEMQDVDLAGTGIKEGICPPYGHPCSGSAELPNVSLYQRNGKPDTRDNLNRSRTSR